MHTMYGNLPYHCMHIGMVNPHAHCHGDIGMVNPHDHCMHIGMGIYHTIMHIGMVNPHDIVCILVW